ncbi:hypothetical protein J2Y46_001088 [Microbacterium sp. BE35]|uniref:hypothetical protein n=1 Tax=Microbacterium sp. BE35 TaxID=2817773 RepID=UPI002863DC27|nr:hypothetical protein [Microbacterium sp. BE35]MDR7188272.1 hypothetical protein [Microbacterium sp. BE35]
MAGSGDDADGEAATASYSESVQDSRAGERFHHVWAAVQSLKLLDQRSGLQTIWIEGAAGDPVAGDEIIDIAEYYGPTPGEIDHVVVRQLKYSTKRRTTNLGLSDLRDTLRKFAMIDTRSAKVFRVPRTATVRYSVVTNRPIGPKLAGALDRIRAGAPATPGSTQRKILELLPKDPAEAAALCHRISFHSNPESLAALRTRLGLDSARLMGGADPGTQALLVEAVSSRTSGEIKTGLQLADIAAAFRVDPTELLPAPSLLKNDPQALPRACYNDIADQILASDRPVLVTADGGAGKSTFATQLSGLVSDRADVVVYDSFGNGEYRAANHYRHRHRDGLVQIAAEIAALGLCSPLVPARGTEAPEYVKAFEARLTEAAARLAASSPGRKLILLVDAADNAAAAAEAEPGDRTFVRDLLQMTPPPNVHIALTCRPYRVGLLHPRPDTKPLELPEFSLAESTALLRARFTDATDSDAVEFHHRTSGNPRTQALVLEDTQSLDECLRSLAGAAASGGNAITQLLTTRLDHIFAEAGKDKEILERTGQLLATLRPRIPVPVLASLSGGDPHLIKSFVADLGRGLLIDEDAVQFLDEPTETFFRERYKLTPRTAGRLAEQLTELSASNAYAAASLPQVLWEAGRYDDLMTLGVSDDALPDTGEVERRQIAQLRTAFALRAAFKLQRPADIVRLALLAGSVAASGDRRYQLLRSVADLTGDFIDSATIDELRAARLLPSEWPGSALGAEALMLAVKADRVGEARSRLRASIGAMRAWVRTPREHGTEHVTAAQTAQVALAAVYVDGPAAAAAFLQQWQPARWVLETSALVVAMLLSRGDRGHATTFGVASRSAALSIGVAAELQRLGLAMDAEQTTVAWDTLRGEPVDFNVGDFAHQGVADAIPRGVAWIAACAVRSGIATPTQAAHLVEGYLPATPPNSLGDRLGRDHSGLLHAYALHARLTGYALSLEDLLPPPTDDNRRDDSDRDRRRGELTPMLPWLDQWARWSLADAGDDESLALIRTYPTHRSGYGDRVLLRRIAGPIAAQLARDTQASEIVEQFGLVLAAASHHSGSGVAADMVACLHGDSRYAGPAYACLSAAAEAAEQEKQQADAMASDLVELARAVYAFDREEARGYYERAVDVASRVGDDVWDRWTAILTVAEAASTDDERDAYLLAARIGRTAEALQPYMDDGFDDRALIRTVRHLTDARGLALLSQWRDRRFGLFEYMVLSLVEEDSGLFTDAPHLAIAFTPFSDRIAASPLVAALEDQGTLDERRFQLIRRLQWVRGTDLDGEQLGTALATRFRIPSLSDPIPSNSPGVTSSSLGDGRYQLELEERESTLRDRLGQLDITTVDGMTMAAAALADAHAGSDVTALVEKISTQPANEWGKIVRAFHDSEAFSARQQLDFLRLVGSLPSNSLALKRALKELAETYITANATGIVSGYGYRVAELDELAALLGTQPRNTLLRAVAAAEPANIVSSADACYRLAGNLAPLMTSTEATAGLRRALDLVDAAVEMAPWRDDMTVIPSTTQLTAATAGFLWSALADPRGSMRWRATHAVRFLLEYRDEEFAYALAGLASAPDAPGGFVESQFPFYRMHAVEALLVAIERAAVADPSAVVSLLSVVATLCAQHPDHLRIQHLGAQIGLHTGSPALADTGIPLRPVRVVGWDDMPHAPRPWGHDAPTSEFQFHFDTDEYSLGPLSESFGVDHADTLNAASNLILDEWNLRGHPALDADPRHTGRAYGKEETFFRKGEVPTAEDFEYYLAYHAALTVAGRLTRHESPVQSADDENPRFARWFADYDLARNDRWWISDARRPTPAGLGHTSPTAADWRWNVSADDFQNAFLGEDGWVTVRQSARNEAYGGRERIIVTSALVDLRTARALVRALQTAPSLQSHRLPFTDYDDDLEVGPYILRGWIQDDNSETGADHRDPFAEDITYPTPRPSQWVRDLLHLSEAPNGLDWIAATEPTPVAVAEAWALKEGGRDPRGPEGTRLRVTSALLAELSAKTQSAIIVEVRFDRDPETRSYHRSDEQLGFLDDYVRYFSYTPDTGWRDYLGRPLAR